MGEVYAGFDERLDRPVALKRIWPHQEEDGTARQRFQREARAVARLHHPAIVQIYDWVESSDGDWIIMELIEGRSLRQLLHEGPLGLGRSAHLARDILTEDERIRQPAVHQVSARLLDGVERVHGQGTVPHHDLMRAGGGERGVAHHQGREGGVEPGGGVLGEGCGGHGLLLRGEARIGRVMARNVIISLMALNVIR
jgi:serine/threonine protein kinase